MSRLLAKRFVPAIPGIRLKSAVIRALLEFAPHLSKLRYGVAQNFRAHYREELHILFFVIDYGQQRHKSIYFYSIKISVVVIHICRQPVFRKDAVKHIPVVFHAAHEDYDVLFFQRSFTTLLTVKERLSQTVPYDLCRGKSLFFRLEE